MGGDNTKWQAMRRARNRVFESILERDSVWMIDQAYQELLVVIGKTDKSHVTLDQLIHDANDYVITIQGGHSVVVSKHSPYARKFIAEAERAEEEMADKKLMRRMQGQRNNRGL